MRTTATMRSVILRFFCCLLLCKIDAASLIEFMRLSIFSDLNSNNIRFLDGRSFAGLVNLTHL